MTPVALEPALALSQHELRSVAVAGVAHRVEDAGVLVPPGPREHVALPRTVAVALHDRGVVALQAWRRTLRLQEDRAEDGSDQAARTRMEALVVFAQDLAAQLADVEVAEEAIKWVLTRIMEFVGESRFRTAHPQYLQGSYYEDLFTSLAQHLQRARDVTDGWDAALDEVGGVGCVPIMTMHKSKGLEYHSIVFVGLEDGALFGFTGLESPRTIEEICGVFVALSRAKARALFSFSGMREESQSRDNLSPLCELLEEAGVSVEEIT